MVLPGAFAGLAIGGLWVHCFLLPSLLILTVGEEVTGQLTHEDAPHRLRLSVVLRDAFVCERYLASQCSNVNAFEELAGSCQQGKVNASRQGKLPEVPPEVLQGSCFPPPSLSLFPDASPGQLGCISRSLQFGRLLWCLVRGSAVRSVLELFTGIGSGSTLLLAHGLLACGAGWLYSFERELQNVAHAKMVLQGEGLETVGVHLEGYSGVDSLAAADALVSRPGARLFHGDLNKHLGLLHVLCKLTGGIDLVVLDPPFDLKEAWPHVEAACKPRFVAIHNVNLPGHAGWIREHLLGHITGNWHEVASGSHPSHATWNDTAIRRWSLLARDL
ncbi:unnamed protein product [Polarella glacialis]|uniref:Uncharacterized protein n=1 Tax=Polarella glacialis TaxID=89957 RepID=A0A813EMX2_POLGL|nr:unnamed protein product [Polarella glacialis]